MVVSHFNRPHGRLWTAGGRHLQQLVEGDGGHLAGRRNQPGVSAEYSGHIGVQLTHVGPKGFAERHRGRIAAPSTQKGDISIGRDTLRAGDDGHDARLEALDDPMGRDLEDFGVAVVGIGDEAGLATGEGVPGHAEIGERHAHEGDGFALPRRDQHVHFPTGADLRDPIGQQKQVVGLLAHGGDDDGNVITTAPAVGDVIGNLPNSIGVGNRRSTVFLHDQGHAPHRSG